MNDNRNKGFALMFVTVTTLMWLAGIALLAMKYYASVNISGAVIALLFWAPYAVFIIAFIAALIHESGGFRRNRK